MSVFFEGEWGSLLTQHRDGESIVGMWDKTNKVSWKLGWIHFIISETVSVSVLPDASIKGAFLVWQPNKACLLLGDASEIIWPYTVQSVNSASTIFRNNYSFFDLSNILRAFRNTFTALHCIIRLQNAQGNFPEGTGVPWLSLKSKAATKKGGCFLCEEEEGSLRWRNTPTKGFSSWCIRLWPSGKAPNKWNTKGWIKNLVGPESLHQAGMWGE